MIAQRDKRRGVRARTDMAVITFSNGVERKLRAVDLSTTGALLRRRSGERPRLIHRLDLDLGNGSKPVEVVARTVWWTRDGWMGVRFVDAHDVDRLEIAEYLDRRSPSP